MRHSLPKSLLAILACLLPIAGGCRRAPPTQQSSGPLPLPPASRTNHLAGSPTAFLRRHAEAPIHWQNWHPTLLATAAESNRLILVFLGSTLYPTSDAVLAALHHSPRIVAAINDNYLPALADVDACRELGIFSSALASEIRKPIAFPFLLWLSPAGNPVAWTPVPNAEPEEVVDLFDQSNNMVASMWRESPDYVADNSARDAKLRLARLTKKPPPAGQAGATNSIHAAVRRFCDLYDPSSGSIDGTGGLPPAGVFELLALAAGNPLLPADLRREAKAVVANTAGRLVHSSMIDPLDGGIYLARRGPSWNLPVFARDTTTQCRMTLALLECWRSTGDEAFLTAAKGALEFAENGLGTGEGRVIHAIVVSEGAEPNMLWTAEELERRLDPPEFRVLAAVSEIKGLGNIPLEADSRRQFFRLNVLALRRPPAEVAPALALPAAEVAATLDRALRKLRKIREQRLAGLVIIETSPYARHHARLASANAALFAATGDHPLRQRALAHLQQLRGEYFDPATGLRQLPKAAEESLRAGRAIDYALTAQACLDVHAVTLDASWIRWVEELVELVAERFIVEDRLREYDSAGKVIDIPLADSIMVFEESTAGVLRAVLKRMSAYLPAAPPALATALETELAGRGSNPIVHTDALTGEFIRDLAPLVYLGPQFGGGTAAALDPLILASGPRRCTFVPANAGFPTPGDLPPGAARLILNTAGQAEPIPFTDLAALAAWLHQNLGAPE